MALPILVLFYLESKRTTMLRKGRHYPSGEVAMSGCLLYVCVGSFGQKAEHVLRYYGYGTLGSVIIMFLAPIMRDKCILVFTIITS